MGDNLTSEKQDSIKLIKNSKGYNWELKRYYNYDQVKPDLIIVQLQQINQKMRTAFGGQQ